MPTLKPDTPKPIQVPVAADRGALREDAGFGGDALPLFPGFRAMLWPGPTWHASPPVCLLEPASCIRQYRLEFAWAVIRRTGRRMGDDSDQPALVGELCIYRPIVLPFRHANCLLEATNQLSPGRQRFGDFY